MSQLFTTLLLASTAAFTALPLSAHADELNSLFTTSSQTLRTPASSPPNDLVKDFTVIAPERRPAAAKSPAQRSRLPASVSDGFELRVQYKKLTSTFWVVKRNVHYDLLFANSSGSQASVGLTPENFSKLFSVANAIRPKENDISKCQESSMQMHVVSTTLANMKGEKTVTICVNAKTKEAGTLRSLSQSLALAVH